MKKLRQELATLFDLITGVILFTGSGYVIFYFYDWTMTPPDNVGEMVFRFVVGICVLAVAYYGGKRILTALQ